MGTDHLITVEDLAGRLKMAAEGLKKKPGLMKPAVGCTELVHKYVARILTAKERGKWVGDPRHPGHERPGLNRRAAGTLLLLPGDGRPGTETDPGILSSPMPGGDPAVSGC
jgi:hypothetical protein